MMKIYENKIVMVVLLLVSFALQASAQHFSAVSEEHQREYLRRIAATSGQMNTMECKFVQTQKMQALAYVAKSEGYMLYRKPNSMRWQYTSPVDYCFLVNNGKVVMKRGGKTVHDAGVRVFARISKMVLASISGTNVVDDRNFINSYEMGGDVFRITMVPRSSGMRRVINSIVMDFDTDSNFIRSIEMNRKNDTTRITFHGKKVNGHIADSQFN